MSQFHFDPATYMDLMQAEVPLYETLQETLADSTRGLAVTRVLDLGTGTGETLARVLAHHPGAGAIGVDENDAMLAVARPRLGARADLRVADLVDPLPEGPFDLVVSALAVHHLDGEAKAALFRRVAGVLRPGGRFVLGDVVLPAGGTIGTTPLSDDYDKPSTLAEQLGWLGDAGLVPRTVWEGDDLAVITADRPS